MIAAPSMTEAVATMVTGRPQEIARSKIIGAITRRKGRPIMVSRKRTSRTIGRMRGRPQEIAIGTINGAIRK